ncbi:MAG: hypothetical protein QOD39_4244 [Mycobacterium sp.]|nr:hypothetical protein [Mycobacterium sp.]
MGEPVLEGLGIARVEFARRLAAVSDWNAATPCGDWKVRQLVNHVVGQEYRFARSLSGGSLDEYVASRDDDFLGGDPQPPGAWASGGWTKLCRGWTGWTPTSRGDCPCPLERSSPLACSR